MSSILIRSAQRHAVRRAVKTPCWAVSLNCGRLLGEQALDLSTDGMMVAGKAPARVGEGIFIVFRAPGPDNLWLRADAEVARVVNGWRQCDPGYAVGLRLTYLNAISRRELDRRLSGLPPPVPGRRVRMDYAESVRKVAYSRTLSGMSLDQL